MTRPAPYECDYAHDRRKHRHRCQACSRIINEGERVVMWAVSKGSRALHIACADVMSFNGVTHRGYAQLQSDEHARRLGYKVPE